MKEIEILTTKYFTKDLGSFKIKLKGLTFVSDISKAGNYLLFIELGELVFNFNEELKSKIENY